MILRFFVGAAILTLLAACADGTGNSPVAAGVAGGQDQGARVVYPVHRDITATVFWVGESGGKVAGDIGNVSSAWDEKWMVHFGGVDDPKGRRGFLPGGFVPRENVFYVALPYNDLVHGRRDEGAGRVVPWAAGRAWGERESMCKNRWVRVSAGGRAAYGQWEDVGPFVTDDAAYVFGGARPRNKRNEGAGIDVSPAVRDYLGLTGEDKVAWQFVEEGEVAAGPWRVVVTR